MGVDEHHSNSNEALASGHPSTGSGKPPPLPPAATAPPLVADAPDEKPSPELASVETSRDSRGFGALLRSMASFLFSMLFHLVLVIGLALWILPVEQSTFLAPLVVDIVDDLDEELETAFLDEQDHPASEVTFATAGGPSDAPEETVSEVELDSKLMDDQIDFTQVHLDTTLAKSFRDANMLMEAPVGRPGQARAVVDGYGEAMDRITKELIQMLYHAPVLVIWCFDQSGSMKDDQKEIRDRIERVYAELDLVDAASDGALKTAVTSFGENYKIHTPDPVHDPAAIRRAIDSIPEDESGKEYMCQAVGRSIAEFHNYSTRGRRKLALILVSDESGDRQDNLKFLEPTIAEAKSARCKVYVLGREAVFGFPYARFRYRHPQTNRPHWLIVDRGPETAFVEQLQTNGFHRRWDAFASGFGSYEQSRLARETGGIFFLLPSIESNIVRGERRRYELEAMQFYKPDLRAREEIFYDRDRAELRMLLWKIVMDLDPHNPQSKDVTELRVHFSPIPATFAKQVVTQVAKAKIYLPYLAAASEMVEKNRALRDKEPEVRWQANFDLLDAQLIAYQARVYEYMAYLHEFMQTPKVVPITKAPNLRLTHWDIRVRKETITGEVIQPYVEEANVLFDKVVREHPGTPWAARATYEKKRGYGIALHPVYEPPYKKVSNPKPLPKL